MQRLIHLLYHGGLIEPIISFAAPTIMCGHRAWDTNGDGWWESLGGPIRFGPSASSMQLDNLEVFAVGTDGLLYRKTWNGWLWSGSWAGFGGNPDCGPYGKGKFTSSPTSVSRKFNHVDVFGRARCTSTWAICFIWGGCIYPEMGDDPACVCRQYVVWSQDRWLGKRV